MELPGRRRGFLFMYLIHTDKLLNSAFLKRSSRIHKVLPVGTYFLCHVIGGDSVSKEQNKKKTAENKDSANIEILPFSPERRWADRRIDGEDLVRTERNNRAGRRFVTSCLLCRSRSLDMAATEDSGKKKRGGKMFGSLERGLDKVITMLTPSKRRGQRDAPRKIKVSASKH